MSSPAAAYSPFSGETCDAGNGGRVKHGGRSERMESTDDVAPRTAENHMKSNSYMNWSESDWDAYHEAIYYATVFDWDNWGASKDT